MVAINKKLEDLATKSDIDELKALIQSQNDKIARQDEEIMSLRSDISKLDDKVAVLTNALDAVCNKADNNEQYSQRYCLRINGIPTERYEKASDCVKKSISPKLI